jgi:predicted CXXCH cytochrome family protein
MHRLAQERLMKQREKSSVFSRLLGALALAGGVATWLVAQEAAPVPTTQPAAPDPRLQQLAARAAQQDLVSGLRGSAHDFSQNEAFGRDLCLPCHTPHLESAPTAALDRRPGELRPLQPHQTPGVELTSWSLLCLGCHDGVAASDVYTSGHALTVADQLSDTRLGTSGMRSHPIGIRYPPAGPDYHPAAAVRAAGLLLPDGRIQCTTCHDAHNTFGHRGMLRVTNRRSQMCLTCHRL